MKRILCLFLALIMLLPSVNVFAQPETNTYFDEYDKKAENIYENENVKSLIFQSKGKLADDDFVHILVTLEPSYFSNLGSMVDANDLYTDGGLRSQVNFGRAAVSKALAEIKASDIDLAIINEFNILMVGFDTEVSFKDAKKIAGFDFIKKITIQKEVKKPVAKSVKPSLFRDAQSRDIIGNETVYSKYKGEGTLVAVIDSGFDPSHEAFYLTDIGRERAIYNEAKIEELKAQGLLDHGYYINEKIPFAYNYFPHTNPEKIKEREESSHGQHVAGTIGGNEVTVNLGDKERKLVGVAPEAQLALMRVFSDESPGTDPSVYLSALEDCVILKATAVNMSLGSVAGDSTDIDPEIIDALNRLEEAGCIVAVAAGNETAFGAGVGYAPKATNPDYGILGSPAAAEKSFAVASIENGFTVQRFFVNKDKNGVDHRFFLSWAKDDSGKTVEPEIDNPREFVYLGLGREEDYGGKDVVGKVALIERGDITFEEKVLNAKEKGASAVLIYNHQEGGDAFVGMAGAGSHDIPVASIYYSTGMELRENGGQVTFKKGRMDFANPLAGQISDFSSFGLTSDGEFKPDITAPGGNIFSLGNNNTYQLMSGTSMATPHAAGGLALARSMVDEKYPDLTTKEKWQRIRNLLMSTAEIHYNGNAPTSPRRQGAGVMKLQNALNTKAILIGDKNESKILRKAASNNIDLSFKIQNLSDQRLTYSYKTLIVADEVKDGYLTYKTRLLAERDNGNISLEPYEIKTVTVNVNTEEFASELLGQMPNGYFIDGFVVFENQEEPTISIPFISFVNDLDRLAYVEPSVYDLVKNGDLPFYWNENANCHISTSLDPNSGEISNADFTHLFTNIEDKTEILGQHKDFTNQDPKFYDKLVLSPNRDGYADYFFTNFTMLRSGYVNVKVYSLDEEGNKEEPALAIIFKDELAMKNYGSDLIANSYYVDIPFPSSDLELEDGDYVVSIESYRDINNPAASVDMPFTIDRKKPSLENTSLENNLLTFDPVDENGIRDVKVSIFDKEIEKGENGYEIPEGTDPKDILIEVKDLGYNSFRTTAQMALEGNSSRAKVQVKLNKEDPDFILDYKIYDEEGREFFEDNLAPGTYKLKISKPDEIYKIISVNDTNLEDLEIERVDTGLVDSSGQKIFKEFYVYNFEIREDGQVDITINIEKLDAYYVYFWVDDYNRYFNGVKLVNKENQEEINLDLIIGKNNDDKYFGVKVFKKLVPYGDYKIVFDADKDNYSFNILREYVNEEGVVVKNKADYNLEVGENSLLNKSGNISYDIKVGRKGKSLSIFGENQDKATYKLALEGMDIDNTTKDINLIRKNLTIDVNGETIIPSEKYLFAPIVEEGYYAEPALAYLNLGDSSKITTYPSKTEFVLEQGNIELQVDILKSEGTGSLVINDNSSDLGYDQRYLVQDISGYFGYNTKAYRDLDNLPEGNYIVSPIVDEATKYISQIPVKLVKITKDQISTVDFTFEDLSNQVTALLIYHPAGTTVKVLNPRTGEEVELMSFPYDEEGNNMTFGEDIEMGVYELIVNDGNSEGYLAPRYFALTNNTMIDIIKGENPLLPDPEEEKLEKALEELKNLVAEVEKIDLSIYTEDSVNTLKEVLAKINMDYSSAAEVEKMIEALRQALAGLVKKSDLPDQPGPIIPNPNDPDLPKPGPDFDDFLYPITSIIFGPSDNFVSKPKPFIEKQVENNGLKFKTNLNKNLSLASFKDINNSVYKAYIEKAYTRGLLKGVGENEFDPSSPITRAMVVESLNRLVVDTKSYKSDFKDVDPEMWFYKSVSWAQGNDIVQGYEDNSFKPNQNLNVEELALIIDRFLEKGNLDLKTSKTTEREVSDWAREYYEKLISSGIFDESDFSDSKDVLRRDQLAKVLVKLAERIEK